mmetsp:Transcript_12123/g.16392  ORF Transcript_12123/g.16392 Transcript_12123/m.16392 type:complete len:411 (+) Transcript_12123:105-1337(+)
MENRGLAVISCLAWSVASTGLVLMNKYILIRFRYPMCLSMLGMCMSTFLSRSLLLLIQKENKEPISMGFYLKNIVPVGVSAAGTLYLGNLSYLYLSVAYIQILKGATPIATLGAAVIMGGVEDSRWSMPVATSLVMIMFGVALASYAELRLDLRGVCSMIFSIFFEATKVILMRRAMLQYKLNPLHALSVFAPPTAFCLGIGTLLVETPGLRRDGFTVMAKIPITFFCAALAGFVLNLLVLAVIHSAGPLTLKVVGMAKNVFLVFVSIIIFKTKITITEYFGYFISICGFYAYNATKSYPSLSFWDAILTTFASQKKVSTTVAGLYKNAYHQDEPVQAQKSDTVQNNQQLYILDRRRKSLTDIPPLSPTAKEDKDPQDKLPLLQQHPLDNQMILSLHETCSNNNKSYINI